VKRFRPRRQDELTSELRARRPEPSPEFSRTISERIGADGRRVRLYAASRLSFAAALTVAMLGTLASFGGLSYAASGTKQTVEAVKHVVMSSRPRVVQQSPAQAQYVEKVTICHKGHTISVPTTALPAHLAHGDTVGPCPVGGVAGASGGGGTGHAQGGGGALGTTVTGGTLPFTGIPFGTTVLVGLLLVTLGLVLRRRADGKS
jgi:hypothetical protein